MRKSFQSWNFQAARNSSTVQPWVSRSRLSCRNGSIEVLGSSFFQADGLAGSIARQIQRKGHGMKATDPVAVEPADRSRLAMIQQHLETVEGMGPLAQHDAGVGRPVRIGFKAQFVVTIGAFGDDIAAPPAAGHILATDDGAILDRPNRRVFGGLFLVIVGKGAGITLCDGRAAGPKLAIGPRRREPAVQRLAVEKGYESSLIRVSHRSCPFNIWGVGCLVFLAGFPRRKACPFDGTNSSVLAWSPCISVALAMVQSSLMRILRQRQAAVRPQRPSPNIGSLSCTSNAMCPFGPSSSATTSAS